MDRPYCIRELRDMNSEINAKYRLSDHVAYHRMCGHTYRVKKGGKKEQYIIDCGSTIDDITCSVCFKLRTEAGQTIDTDTIGIMCKPEDDDNLTRAYIDQKDRFYRWLYRHDFY